MVLHFHKQHYPNYHQRHNYRDNDNDSSNDNKMMIIVIIIIMVKTTTPKTITAKIIMTYNNSKQAGELRRHRAHYAVIVMNITHYLLGKIHYMNQLQKFHLTLCASHWASMQ